MSPRLLAVVSRRVDHRLGAGSGRFSSSGSNMMGTIAIPNPELLLGMETMQVPAPVPLLPSPERKGITTTSRLHEHIRGPDNDPESVVPGDVEAMSRNASRAPYSKRLERKDDDDDNNNDHYHNSSSSSSSSSRSRSKQQTDSRSDHRLADRGASVTTEGRHRGEEKVNGEYTYANDQGNTFRAPRINQATSNDHGQYNGRGKNSGTSTSTSHLSCYSGGHLHDDDDDDEEVCTKWCMSLFKPS